jgi:hypothetical protein
MVSPGVSSTTSVTINNYELRLLQPNVLASGVSVDTKPSRSGLLAQLDAQLGSLSNPSTSARPALTSKVSLPLRRSAAGNSVKPEPTDSIVPRKRSSSSLVYLGAENEEEKPVLSTPPVSKRASFRPPKASLAFANPKMESLHEHVHVPPPHHQVVLPVLASYRLF